MDGAQCVLTADPPFEGRKSSRVDDHPYENTSFRTSRVTYSLDDFAKRDMSLVASMCRPASDLHTRARVFLALASVPEFRSTINRIDRILTRFPLLHHMAFGWEWSTMLVSLLHERVDMVALYRRHRLQHIIDCCCALNRLENSTTSNVNSVFDVSFLQLFESVVSMRIIRSISVQHRMHMQMESV